MADGVRPGSVARPSERRRQDLVEAEALPRLSRAEAMPRLCLSRGYAEAEGEPSRETSGGQKEKGNAGRATCEREESWRRVQREPSWRRAGREPG
eukprot:3532996-Rhodomonas_salina.1